MKLEKRKAIIIGLAVLALLPALFTSAQGKHIFVTLRVKYNGRVIPSPEQVTLVFRGHPLTLHLEEGRFDVPPAVLKTKEVQLLTRIGNEQIHISGIYGSEFQQDGWTLILADKQYDADNQWVVPKGASVRSSCILVFESKSSEGTEIFEPHCR